MSRIDDLKTALEGAFNPIRLEVTDDSSRHIGHAGARPEGQTHYSVHVVSSAFQGKPRVMRHRMVYQAIGGEWQGGLHALAISALTPEEAGE